MTETHPSVLLSVEVNEGTIPVRPHTTIVGNLNVEGWGSMVFLPEGLRIDGDLLLRGTSIRELPEMLDVRGKIELEGCKSLTRLCDDLRVGGDLDLEGCDAITTLPQNMFVGGNLYLAGTKISEIPASAIVKGMVYDLAA